MDDDSKLQQNPTPEEMARKKQMMQAGMMKNGKGGDLAMKKQKMRQMMEEDEKKMGKLLGKYGVSKKKVMLALMLSLFVDILGYSMILPLLPQIALVFGASDFMVGIVIAANAFAAMIFAPIWGKLSDKYGRKKLLMVNQIGTLFAFLILATADSFEMILIARLVDGMFGGQFPIIKSVASDITTHRTRMKTMSKIMMGIMMGMIIGPAIGGLLGSLNWRYPAYMAAVLALISFSLTWKFLVETMPPERIADIKAHLEANKIKSDLWTRNFKVRLTQILLMNFAFIAITTSLPLVLLKRYDAGPLQIGALMSFNGLVMVLTMGIAVRKLGDKFTRQGMYTFAMAMMLIAYFMYSFLSAYWMYFIFLGILTIGNAFARPLSQTNLLKAAPPDQQGAASGWGTNMQSIAETTAPLVAMWFLHIGGTSVGALAITSYVLIGITAFIIAAALATLIAWDIKANHEDF